MDLTQQQQIYLGIAVVASVVIILLIGFFSSRLKQARQQQTTLGDSYNELSTSLALEQQANEQLRQQYAELKSSFSELQHKNQQLQEALHNVEKNNQAIKMELSKDRELSAQRLQQFEENRKQLKIEFENLAGKVLDEKTKTFSASNQSSIESLLKPFREQIEGFQKRVNDVHSDTIKGNTMLESEIKKVLDVGLKMGSDAKNLTSVLKGDSQKRGVWGEGQLEKTLEMSGLLAGAHYEKQTAYKDSEGRRKQPDYLVNLPDGKQIIIDSKVSLVAYDRVVSAETPELQTLALSEHANAVKRHIDDLSSKDYTNLVGVRSPSFVLMFMPIEPAYIEALKHGKDLFLYGYEKNIVLVSHTTLIPILRTVANLWMMERSNTEAREIGQKAGEIFNQVCKVATKLQKLGGSLGAASNHYNDTLTALVGRQGLYGKIERFGQLSSKVSQSMPQLEPIHDDLRHESLDMIVEAVEEEKRSTENIKLSPKTDDVKAIKPKQ